MKLLILIILGSILLLALIVFIDYKIAMEFVKIADKKGHNGRHYFWWMFWLSVVGYLMVIALPDRGEQKTVTVNSAKTETPAPEEIPDI